MNNVQSSMNLPDNSTEQSHDGLSLLSFLIVIAKRKKLVLGIVGAAIALSVVVSMLLPPVYQASTKLLPPSQSQSSSAALLSQLGGMAGAFAGSAGLKSPNDTYVGMLKSRTVADNMVRRFDLKRVYGEETGEAARRRLETNTIVTSGKDGLITIDVKDRDAERAALLANSYVDELSTLTKVLAVTEASRRRMFFEKQLELAKNNLATAETTLRRSLSNGGVISVDSESRAIVETVGRVRAQVSAKEIELGSMKAFVTSHNPDYQRVQEELSSLRAELSRLENGNPNNAGAAEGKQGGLENIKVLRDVKYYQMLYELLAKQYEGARLDEAKDSTIIQVLDPAIKPERRTTPKRALIVIFSTLFGLLIATIIAFLLETRERALRKPGGSEKWRELKNHLLSR
ncbi:MULTISPECIES: Wzz/FepE/Etk N-terminal domain-containing protein [unclassified Massilia]|uniref:GumC family protein n=1 Tax=unclassified Massilia TaxID=2609279 RepID=UPI001E625CFF|nr:MULTISPECIES: Wzz/FepE/Etk N-terminal domain-containing protein [unclassified Massilia]